MTYDRWKQWRDEQARLNRAINRVFLILLGLTLGAFLAIKYGCAQQVAGTGKTGPNGSMIGYNAAGPNWLYVPVDTNGYILVDCPGCSSGGIVSINGDTTPAQQFKASGGGLSVTTVGGITTYILTGGGLTGGVNSGSGNQVGCYPTNAAAGTTIGPCANIYALDPAMSKANINTLLSGLSGSNTYFIPNGMPQIGYTNPSGQNPHSFRLSDDWFQMPGVACDGKQSALNIPLTSGSNTSNVGATLSSADIGKTFFFFNRSGYAYGSTQNFWAATLTAYTFPTATWSANAPFNFNTQVYYGTDNLSTINNQAMPQASAVFPLTIPTGCKLLVNGTIAWNNAQVVVGRHQGQGGFIGAPAHDVIATTDTSGQSISSVGVGLGKFTVINSTEIDWTLGYNSYAADGTLTVVPPIYRPLFDHTSLAPDPCAPGWITNCKNGVAVTTAGSAVICVPTALGRVPTPTQTIMFPYFASIFTAIVNSNTGAGCAAGFTGTTLNAALPAGDTAAQAEWFTGTAIQSTTTTIPATGITYPLVLSGLNLSTNPTPGYISNFPQHGTLKACGSEFEYMGTTASTVTLRRGPTTSNGCTGTTVIAPVNMCRAKNLLGSTADQPWPVFPSVNSGDSTPSGANWFPGECGGNFGVAFPSANGNVYVGAGLVGGFLQDLNFVGSAAPGTNSGNANNAGAVYMAGNNQPFGSHIDNLVSSNLQYGMVQGPASAGQHGVAAVGPTGFGNTIHNLWLFAAFPLAFVDFQGSDVTGLNMNSAEISPFDGTAIGSATCLQIGFTLDEQTGAIVTSSQFNTVHPHGCEPENGSHIEVLPAVDIQGSHIAFDTANFEGIPNVFGGDHLKLLGNTFLGLPTIDYGNSNDFGLVDGSNAGYITNIWDPSHPAFIEWGKNAMCSAFAGGQGPAVACGAGTVQGYQGRGIEPSIYGTKAHFILGGMITPWMWNNNGAFDTNPFTQTGTIDALATYWGSSSQCSLGSGASCHSAHFNGFNGYLYIGPFNQIYDGAYSLDATFRSASGASSFTLTIKAVDSGSGQCSSPGTVYTGTVTTGTSYGPGPAPDFDFTGKAGCVLDITYSAGSTTDTIFTDRFNLVPRPGYVRGPVSAPTYPGSCPAGTPSSSWLGSFSGFAYFCDGGTVHRVAIT